ncbi:MAG: DUF4340 domain-containing protein [Acidobacteria bacterium]|nr:DUF4340 domain-containing protein [Acidobacteriota bacterium]
MQARSLAILLATVLSFGAFIWFFERDLPSSDERKELATRLFRIAAADVLSAEITVGEEVIAFERSEGPEGDEVEDAADADEDVGWRITRPLESPAENFRVDGLVRTVVELSSSRSLAVDDAEAVGLAPPRGTVTLGLRGGDSLTVEVGAEVPASSNMIVRVAGDPEAHVTSDSLWSDLTRPVGDWRRTAMFPAVAGDIESFRVTGPEGTVELVRDQNGFRLARPVSDRASAVAVDSFSRSISGLRARSFVDDLSDVAALGFDPPASSVEVGFGDDQSLLLEWGAEVAAGDGHYARIGEVIFETIADLGPALSRSAQEWRSHAWTTIAGFEVDQLRIDDEDGSSNLVRDSGDWTRDGDRIDFGLVSRLLDAVTDAEAESVLSERPAELALGEPLIVLTLTTRGDTVETLRLYSSDADGGPIATTEGRDAALLMTPDLAADLAARIEAIREADPPHPNS